MGDFNSLDLILRVLILIVAALIIVVGIFSSIVSIMLVLKYVKYNRKKNSLGLSGKDLARKILDDANLQNIKVKCSGSLLFGNSYSHFFKKVRLRRLTWKKESVTSLAMAAQKCSLAILDKDNDKDMKKRITLTPFIYFGPVMCVPLIVIGVIIDVLVFNGSGTVACISTGLGILLYALSFVMAIMVLKTEKKAQEKALMICKMREYATEEELEDMKVLFKLYNIEYINDMVMALLELIYRVLIIIAKAKSNQSNNN